MNPKEILGMNSQEVKTGVTLAVLEASLARRPDVYVGDDVYKLPAFFNHIWGLTYTARTIKDGQLITKTFSPKKLRYTVWGPFRTAEIYTRHDFLDNHAKFYLLRKRNRGKPEAVLVGSHNFVTPSLFDVSVLLTDKALVTYFHNLFKEIKKCLPSQSTKS